MIARNLHILIGAVLVQAAAAQAAHSAMPAAKAIANTPRAVAGTGDIVVAKNVGRPPRSAALVCGWAGIRVRPMTAAFADSLGLTARYGAIFDRPARGSPAAQANIEAGDVITAINGVPLSNWRDFAPTIAKTAPGTTVYFTTWRNRQLIDVAVVLGSGRCPSGRGIS